MVELDFSIIGQRIKEVRNERNLTQEYIANVTGVNVSHISNIETNKKSIAYLARWHLQCFGLHLGLYLGK